VRSPRQQPPPPAPDPLGASPPPTLARLRRIRTSGAVYSELDPNGWYAVERQNPRTLWLLTREGAVEVARQDVEMKEAPAPAAREVGHV